MHGNRPFKTLLSGIQNLFLQRGSARLGIQNLFLQRGSARLGIQNLFLQRSSARLGIQNLFLQRGSVRLDASPSSRHHKHETDLLLHICSEWGMIPVFRRCKAQDVLDRSANVNMFIHMSAYIRTYILAYIHAFMCI